MTTQGGEFYVKAHRSSVDPAGMGAWREPE